MVKVVVTDHGAGNIASVVRALRHVGADVVVSHDPSVVSRAGLLVVPGQGAFRDAMSRLRETGLDDAIREHLGRERPYLGICLGLQVLFDRGLEHSETPGLGVLRGQCGPLAREAGIKIPHMGWNTVRAPERGGVVWPFADGEHFYFVHSFVVTPAEPLSEATTRHGSEFVSAISRGSLFACQFHPEKSQRAGLELLRTVVADRSQ